MELSGKTVYSPVLKTMQLSAHTQNHASPERCGKSFTVIFLGDHDIPLTGSNFVNLTALTVSAKFEVDTTIRCLVIALLLLIRYVTL